MESKVDANRATMVHRCTPPSDADGDFFHSTDAYAHKQAYRHKPCFQLAPHLGDSYFRTEHHIRTCIASSSFPCLCSLCLLCLLFPSGLSCTTPFSLLYLHLILHISSHPILHPDNSLNFPIAVFLPEQLAVLQRSLVQQTRLRLVRTWAAVRSQFQDFKQI